MTHASPQPTTAAGPDVERVTGFQAGVEIPDDALDLVSGAAQPSMKANCVLTDHGEDAFCA